MIYFARQKWISILGNCIILLNLLSATNVAAQEVPQAPGRLINVGTHQLHIHCTGKGSPTVILEAGLGGAALEWTKIQANLSHSLRVCSYDRAGLGWSDAGPLPRSAMQITDELFTLLQNAQEPAPYVLVGHSLGGYSAQLFANRFSQLCAGLVLIDSSHPEQIERFAASPVKINIAPKGMLMHLVALQVAENIPVEVKETATALSLNYKARLAATKELQSFRRSAQQLMKHAQLPNIPLLVLTRGVQKWPDSARGNRMEALWQQLQSELALKTNNAVQIIARRSGHNIHLDQPELVSEAIQLLAITTRQQGETAQRDWLTGHLRAVAVRFADTIHVEYTSVDGPLVAMRH